MARKKKQSKQEPIGGVDYQVLHGYRVYKEELESLADALNENMQFDPDDQIDTDAGLGELITEVTETFDEVFTTDEFEPEQWATLYKMGCMPVEPNDDDPEAEAPVEEWPEELMEGIEDILEEAKDEPEPESEPEPEPEKKKGKSKKDSKKSSKKKEPKPEPEKLDVEDLLKELKTLKKKKELDQFVEDHEVNISTAERNPIKFRKMIADVLKGEDEPAPKKEKAESKKAPKKSSSKKEKAESKKAPKKEKAEKPAASKTKSHEEAFMDALDKIGEKGATMEKLAEKGNEIYCKANGGEGSEAMQRKQGLVIVKALIRYGVVEKEGKSIVLLEED